MRKYFIFVALAMVLNNVAIMANGATLLWDRNNEADMKDYNVYGCTPNPSCTIAVAPANLVGTVPQPASGVVPTFNIPSAFEGKLGVTARDLSLNESGLSVTIPFDVKAPVIPANPRLGP